MNFELSEALSILDRTPRTLRAALTGLPEVWFHARENAESWSPYEILGHLIHGEKTDWTERTKILLSDSDDPAQKTFVPFDRSAHLQPDRGRGATAQDLAEQLDEFDTLRAQNLDFVRGLDLGSDDFRRRATHPSLGPVTLHNLYSAWAVHDLGHVAQIHRTMARRYREDVGPWREYMPILD